MGRPKSSTAKASLTFQVPRALVQALDVHAARLSIARRCQIGRSAALREILTDALETAVPAARRRTRPDVAAQPATGVMQSVVA